MAADMPITLDEIQRMYDRPAIVAEADSPGAPELVKPKALNVAQGARKSALKTTGMSLGIKAGIAYQIGNINTAVAMMSRDLDSIYDFTPLLIQYRVVPPVITEARDLYHQDGDNTIRLSGALYKIERTARFVSLAPSWREYLTFDLPVLRRDSMYDGLAPATAEEADIWKLAVRDGWYQGVEQANIMLQGGLDRLNRDYVGMARFHRFVKERKISMPIVADQKMPLNLSGDSIAVDETLLRITVLPEWNGNMDAWLALPLTDPIIMSGRLKGKETAGIATPKSAAPKRNSGAAND